jgi:hypothetical protein
MSSPGAKDIKLFYNRNLQIVFNPKGRSVDSVDSVEHQFYKAWYERTWRLEVISYPTFKTAKQTYTGIASKLGNRLHM